MWDLLSLMRLENWKKQYGNNITQWIHAIGQLDAYCCMADFTCKHPEFVFPEIVNHVVLEANELGHPLILPEKRVDNDFKIDKSGQINIITGANMAGKSTFLRTIGINLILAMTGMPVCAKQFNFSLVQLFSGMRTSDSLKENESYFYAELKRLKQIINELKSGKELFILLDEILKGTNSVDKAKGSWKFVEHLIKLNATGVIATHDLTLCELENKNHGKIKNKCFEVEISGEKIFFDYQLRNGITKNMNASLLMKQMGIF
jgi:DNA mismatch repair ATPase MutS